MEALSHETMPNVKCKSVLWSDETKVEALGHDFKIHDWQKKKQATFSRSMVVAASWFRAASFELGLQFLSRIHI